MRTRTLLIVLLYILLSPLASLGETSRDGKLFLDAKNAAQTGEWPLFYKLKEQLTHYPLLPYLEYYEIDGNFKTVKPILIQQFLDKYPNTPLAYRLRTKWLLSLAKSQKWESFLAVYKPTSSTVLQCNYLLALQQTGKTLEANDQIPLLWKTGSSQPGDCDIVFATWLETKSNKDSLLWQRFELALKNYNFGLANYLSNKMSTQKKKEALAIIKLYSQPSLINYSTFRKKYPSPEVISFGIARIAYSDPFKAIHIWNQLENKYKFTEAQKQRIFQAIALKLALRKNKSSLIWFQQVIYDQLDPIYQDWLVRAGIYHQDWKLVKNRIASMPEKERELSKWQYWHARALEQLGDKRGAMTLFTKAARQPDYYGFLAQHHINRKIKILNLVPTVSTNEINSVKQLPGFQRAVLLYQLKREYDAMLELNYLMKEVDLKQQYIIAKLISDWQWYPETLILINKSVYKNDITLRFPLLYEKAVFENARLRKLNPSLIYAVIRQESYFGSESISPAGAIGLMQLMPTTAMRTSKKFRLKYSNTQELLNPNSNIAFGSAHLKETLGNFSNNPVLAIAAYNAGSKAVNRWLPKNTTIPTDIWIESIPFHETRNYIKNIIANFIIYQYRLGQTPNLDNIMPFIK